MCDSAQCLKSLLVVVIHCVPLFGIDANQIRVLQGPESRIKKVICNGKKIVCVIYRTNADIFSCCQFESRVRTFTGPCKARSKGVAETQRKRMRKIKYILYRCCLNAIASGLTVINIVAHSSDPFLSMSRNDMCGKVEVRSTDNKHTIIMFDNLQIYAAFSAECTRIRQGELSCVKALWITQVDAKGALLRPDPCMAININALVEA
jgi:hypothetical protein